MGAPRGGRGAARRGTASCGAERSGAGPSGSVPQRSNVTQPGSLGAGGGSRTAVGDAAALIGTYWGKKGLEGVACRRAGGSGAGRRRRRWERQPPPACLPSPPSASRYRVLLRRLGRHLRHWRSAGPEGGLGGPGRRRASVYVSDPLGCGAVPATRGPAAAGQARAAGGAAWAALIRRRRRRRHARLRSQKAAGRGWGAWEMWYLPP